jgi:outer membrane protein assembly factor BamA
MLRSIRDSEHCSRKSLSVFFLFLLLNLILFAPMSYSLTKEVRTVSKVTVSIDGHPSEGTIDELILIRPGDSFSLKEINDSIKRVYRTDLFSDISVVKSGQQNVELTFLLTSQKVNSGVNCPL